MTVPQKADYRPLLKGKKAEVAFLFQAGTVWPSLESVYRACMSDDRFDVRLIWLSENAIEKSHTARAGEYLLSRNLDYTEFDKVDWSDYSPHVIFMQLPYDTACHIPAALSERFLQMGIRVAYVPYGLELSDTEQARRDHFNSFVVENAWRIYVSCDGIAKEYRKYCRNREAVRVCGSPKLDGVKYKDQWPIEPWIIKKTEGRKLIVWKIHFPKRVKEAGEYKQITPDLREYIRFASSIEQYGQFYFIILLHPKMLESGGVVADDGQRELVKILKSKKNVWIDGCIDYRSSLYHADAIIMDRSGIMAEAAMTGVPVLYLTNGSYKEPLTPPVQSLADSFYQGTCSDDIMMFLSMLDRHEDERKDLREQAFHKEFPLSDGKSGERIKEELLVSLTKEQNPVAKQRILLYGTGEICKYYMEEQNWQEAREFDICGIADSDAKKWGREYWGKKILSPEELIDIPFDYLVIMTEAYYYDIKKMLVYDYYIDERRIRRLDEFVAERLAQV